MTIHLVYPVDFSKISAPWTLGNNLYKYFVSKNFKVKVYQWTSFEKIIPKKNDILIGHAHPNPMTCFRRSLDSKKWKSVNLLQPYNEDLYQLAYLNKIIDKCDRFFAICGEYWFDRIKNSAFKSWQSKMIRVDMGISENDYPILKNEFNTKGKRKFLYIGNDYKFNNFAKNLKYLEKIITYYGPEYFGVAGNKKIENVKFHGWLDFKNKKTKKVLKDYDFYIIVSKNDANPTTILESMSWGLIPFCTKECGYYNTESIINLPINSYFSAIEILKKYQLIDQEKLFEIQSKNFELIKNRFNWQNICKLIFDEVFSEKKFFVNSQTYEQKKYFTEYEEKSLNYYKKLPNLISFFKTSIKFFFKKFLFTKRYKN